MKAAHWLNRWYCFCVCGPATGHCEGQDADVSHHVPACRWLLPQDLARGRPVKGSLCWHSAQPGCPGLGECHPLHGLRDVSERRGTGVWGPIALPAQHCAECSGRQLCGILLIINAVPNRADQVQDASYGADAEDRATGVQQVTACVSVTMVHKKGLWSICRFTGVLTQA